MSAAAFRRRLLDWYARAARDLPWRRTQDPYRIWVSEVMLQQTRAAAAIPYYERFLALFPTIERLASAPEQEVLAAWSGLGYYTRARNLRKAAALAAARGGFPETYDAIRALPGAGDYTAAAVASIAFGEPRAALDGNVARVMARFTADKGDIAAPATRERLRSEAQRLLDRGAPGAFNQAMMELGATLCLPREPRCMECPIASGCRARRDGIAHELPVKLRRVKFASIPKTLLIIQLNRQILLWQRGPDSRQMAGFWELPEPGDLKDAALGKPIAAFQHTITHRRYAVTVARAKLRRAGPGFEWVKMSALDRIPLSTLARKALIAADRERTVSAL